MAIITVAIVTTAMRIIATTPPIIAALSSSSAAKLNSVVDSSEDAQSDLIYYSMTLCTDMCRSTGRLVVRNLAYIHS